MNLLKEIKAVWQLDNKEPMEDQFSYFSTLLEISTLEKEELRDIIYFLLEKGIEELDRDLQNALFALTSSAVFDQKMGPEIDWRGLIAHLPGLKGEALIYSIDFLAASGVSEYIPLLEPYTHSPDRNIRDPALEAIRYLQQS